MHEAGCGHRLLSGRGMGIGAIGKAGRNGGNLRLGRGGFEVFHDPIARHSPTLLAKFGRRWQASGRMTTKLIAFLNIVKRGVLLAVNSAASTEFRAGRLE